LKNVRRELGKLLTHPLLTPRKMAAILGQVRSFLTAMPFLRSFTDMMLRFIRLEKKFGWESKHKLPTEMIEEVKTLGGLMDSWKVRELEGKAPVRILHSDSSSHAWAGIDLGNQNLVQDSWRDSAGLHINVKELTAAIHTIKSLARPQEKVLLCVDNSVAYHYLKKGGRFPISINS